MLQKVVETQSDAAARIREMLGVSQESWRTLAADTLAPGTRLGAIAPLFPRIEKTVEELRAMTDAPVPAPAPTPAPAPAPAAPVTPVAAPAAAETSADTRIGIDEIGRAHV